MKNVKVLGPGCKRCETTADMVRAEAERLGVAIELEPTMLRSLASA